MAGAGRREPDADGLLKPPFISDDGEAVDHGGPGVLVHAHRAVHDGGGGRDEGRVEEAALKLAPEVVLQVHATAAVEPTGAQAQVHRGDVPQRGAVREGVVEKVAGVGGGAQAASEDNGDAVWRGVGPEGVWAIVEVSEGGEEGDREAVVLELLALGARGGGSGLRVTPGEKVGADGLAVVQGIVEHARGGARAGHEELAVVLKPPGEADVPNNAEALALGHDGEARGALAHAKVAAGEVA
jgi:hypothetical protein